MSRASRRERRESAKRANNPKQVNSVLENRHHSSCESKEDRMKRMQQLYRQNKGLGE